MRVAVDCHMVGQPRAGDAGNGRFHAMLARALAQTAALGDRVAALVAHPEAVAALDGYVESVRVPDANLRRLAGRASRRLGGWGAQAAVFSYVAPLRSPCPVALVVHDPSFLLYPQWFSRRDRAMLSALVPRAAQRAAALVTPSHTAKRDLVAALGIDPARVSVIPNAVAPAFCPAEGAAARVRARFGLDRYCLAVGDVHPRKNLGALAEAIARLGDRRHLELALVGRPGHRGREIAGEVDACVLGPVSDEELADLYRAAAVTAYPSLYEGFGLPVVEAMACGSPVVAAARGAVPEVAGEAAILVEPTPEAIAEGLRAALEPDTAARLREAGPPQAARYGARAMGEAGWAVLRAIAA